MRLLHDQLRVCNGCVSVHQPPKPQEENIWFAHNNSLQTTMHEMFVEGKNLGECQQLHNCLKPPVTEVIKCQIKNSDLLTCTTKLPVLILCPRSVLSSLVWLPWSTCFTMLYVLLSLAFNPIQRQRTKLDYCTPLEVEIWLQIVALAL